MVLNQESKSQRKKKNKTLRSEWHACGRRDHMACLQSWAPGHSCLLPSRIVTSYFSKDAKKNKCVRWNFLIFRTLCRPNKNYLWLEFCLPVSSLWLQIRTLLFLQRKACPSEKSGWEVHACVCVHVGQQISTGQLKIKESMDNYTGGKI